MKKLIISAIVNAVVILLFVSSCKDDRDYLRNRYLQHQLLKDNERGRGKLYRQSYYGIYREETQEDQYYYHEEDEPY